MTGTKITGRVAFCTQELVEISSFSAELLSNASGFGYL
jgi:hypothetical protein